MEKKITKEVGVVDGKKLTVINFAPENIVKINLGDVDIVILKDETGEVSITVDNHQDNTTLVTSLGKENDFRWY